MSIRTCLGFISSTEGRITGAYFMRISLQTKLVYFHIEGAQCVVRRQRGKENAWMNYHPSSNTYGHKEIFSYAPGSLNG
jgi:hypothetical protein